MILFFFRSFQYGDFLKKLREGEKEKQEKMKN